MDWISDSKFERGRNLLIGYLTPDRFRKQTGFDHADPLIDEFTYGQAGGFSDFVRSNVDRGSYVFFHATIGGQRYITAYYLVSDVKEGFEARHDPEIRRKYRNPHLNPSREWWGTDYDPNQDNEPGDPVIFGDPARSKDIRKNPLPFDRALAEKLEFEKGNRIRFDLVDKNGRVLKDTDCISRATRQIRIVTDKDVQFLLDRIADLGKGVAAPPPGPSESRGSLEESTEISSVPYALSEREMEQAVFENPELIGKGTKVLDRQLKLPNGRAIDLLLEDKGGNPVVVEFKQGTAPDQTLTQLQSYIKHVRTMMKGKNVVGAIVCGDCSVSLKEAAESSGVKIYFFELKPQCTKVV